MINKALDLPFPEPEETYSNSDYLYEELEIPRTATGKLPRGQRTREGLEAEAVEDLGETGRKRPPQRTEGRSGGRASGGGRADGGSAGRSREGAAPRRRRTAPAAGSASGASSAERGAAGETSGDAPRRRRRRRRVSGTGPDGGAAPDSTG